MKTDFYTKMILTLIAACLAWMCIQPVFSPEPASAQTTQRVVIVGIDGIQLLAKGQPALPVKIVQSAPEK
jgi:hypothetical protein